MTSLQFSNEGSPLIIPMCERCLLWGPRAPRIVALFLWPVRVFLKVDVFPRCALQMYVSSFLVSCFFSSSRVPCTLIGSSLYIIYVLYFFFCVCVSLFVTCAPKVKQHIARAFCGLLHSRHTSQKRITKTVAIHPRSNGCPAPTIGILIMGISTVRKATNTRQYQWVYLFETRSR